MFTYQQNSLIVKAILWLSSVLIVGVIFYLFIDPIELSSEEFLTRYSKNELLYFRDIGFGYPDKIKRWNQPIRVTIARPYTTVDQAEVKEVIRELSTIRGLPAITLVGHSGNLTVHFPTSIDDFNSNRNNDPRTEPLGYTTPVMSFSNHVKSVHLFISPIADERSKKRILRHEFCHALGLWGHSKRSFPGPHLLGITNYESIAAYEIASEQQVTMSEADRKALQLLYESDMPNHLGQATFDDYLKKRFGN